MTVAVGRESLPEQIVIVVKMRLKYIFILCILFLFLLVSTEARPYGAGRFGIGIFGIGEAEITPSPGGGGGGSPAGGGGGASSAREVECTVSTQCGPDQYCLNNVCVKLFDLKILQFDSPVEPGQSLDFTYLAKSMADSSGDVTLEFWLEKDKQRVTSGSDVIFISGFEEKIESTHLYLPSDLREGDYTLYVKLSFEKYEVMSYRGVEVRKNVLPSLSVMLLHLPEISNGNLSALISTNSDESVLVVVRREISKKKQPVWMKEESLIINRTLKLTEAVPLLSSGEYVVQITATMGNLTTKTIETFSIVREGENLFGQAIQETVGKSKSALVFLFISLLAVLVIGVTLLTFYLHRRKSNQENKLNQENEGELNQDNKSSKEMELYQDTQSIQEEYAEIVRWVQKARFAGVSESEIKRKMILGGWSKEETEKVLRIIQH